jgi:hypothetical protein
MPASFSLPEDYNAPSGVKEGAEFTDIAQFKIEGNEIHILSIGEDKTPVGGKGDKKPKGAKQAIKEQLSSLEDKEGEGSMEDTGDQY